MKKNINHKKSSLFLSLFCGISCGCFISSFSILFTKNSEVYIQMIVFSIIAVLISPFLVILFYKGLKPKYNFVIDGAYLYYELDGKRTSFLISNIDGIKKVIEEGFIYYYLILHESEPFSLGKVVPIGPIKKLAKILNLKIEEEPPRTLFKMHDFLKAIKEEIVLRKVEIISSIIGAFITALCFVFNYYFYSLMWLRIMMAIIAFIFGYIHLCFIYLKRKKIANNRVERVIIGLFFSIIIIAIFFGVVTLFCIQVEKMPFTYEYFLYAIYLYPSFVIVLLLIGLIISGM